MSDKPKSQNDAAWESLFNEYDILGQIDRNDQFVISAAQIKKYREPRLMAKFDHNINLPRIFSENKLAILPISRGDYVISHFQAYQPFESRDNSVTRANLPPYLQSLNPDGIPSETIAINCAFASGMLADFLGEDRLFSTVAGRMGSGCFSFDIAHAGSRARSHIDVNNSQIEIDAAFEGFGSLSLLEAKRDISEDFLIRQLYYPYRVWRARVSKKVRPIFLVYSNGIFNLYEYEFEDPSLYNSLVLIRQKNYSIEDTQIKMADLLDVMKRSHLEREPRMSFPQADKFERVINLCELLPAHGLSREQVTEEYAFDIRQTNYYTDAGRYLGLIDKSYESGHKPVYVLSKNARRILSLPYKQRQLAFCGCILQHKAFYDTFRLCVARGAIPEKGEIVEIMKQSDLYHVESESTFERRASTISGWINWMLDLLQNRSAALEFKY